MGRGAAPMPYLIFEIDIINALPDLLIPKHCSGFALIVRRKGRPIGFLMREINGPKTISSQYLRQIIQCEIETHMLKENAAENPLNYKPKDRLSDLTVAICTRKNPEDLANCLLRLTHLQKVASNFDFNILIVDNSSGDRHTKKLSDLYPGIAYVKEPKPGLNFARNRAIKEAREELIAFIDDDVVADHLWLNGLAKAVTEHPDAAAFTGLVLPLQLETEAQILFEKRGGFEKNFKTIRYGQTLTGHSFYPCVGGKFGTGCNMAFRRQILLDIGGFDEALDAGAPLPGGGDTDILYRVVRAGYPIIYEPQFMVFHKHRREYRQLRRQYSHSWALGLMAYVAKTYKHDVTQRANLRRLVTFWFHSHFQELLCSLKGKHALSPDLILPQIWWALIGLIDAYPRSVKRTQKIHEKYSHVYHKKKVG